MLLNMLNMGQVNILFKATFQDNETFNDIYQIDLHKSRRL